MKEENWTEQTAKNALRAEASKSSHVIVEALPFDTTQVTSPQNGNNPKWGDPCHPLAAQGHPPTVIAKTYDARGKGNGETVNTLTGDHNRRITDYTSVIVENAPIYCIDGDKMGKAERAGGSGLGIRPGDNLTESPELYPTLQAKPGGGHSLNFSGACRIEYIVRRLTPTECARLQGFADRWGEIDRKDSFTAEEFQFWQDVRSTHAAINGRAVKDYTETQMLNWYNKLRTDSAEYKMWGNGIALPPALYCMQGIAYALEEVEDDWML